MRSGTPGFVGDRLREAREIRSLTATALAEIVDVTPQAISQYEHDKSSPSHAVLERIASTVNLPVRFFTLPPRPTSGQTIFYRSMAATTKSARSRASRRYGWLRDIVGYLSEFVDLPEVNLPDLRLPADHTLLTNDDIDHAAEDLRTYWNLREGPISNIVLLLENHGIIVARDRLGADTLDGLSDTVDGRPYLMIGTDKGTAARWRFDAAHELGHILLHGSVRADDLRNSQQHKQIEDQAHRFAAAFLLPFAAFGDDLFAANLDAFVSLKPKWGVSVAMMIRRSHDAGFVSDANVRKLWINHSRNGWKRREPFDDSTPPEEPRLLRRAFELILEAGDQTSEDILSTLALPPADVESLAGLPSGFLNEYSPVSLAPSPEPVVESYRDEPWRGANVVDLPFNRRRH